MKQHVHVQAHRGANLEARENTLASISRAVELNVDSVEIDIHLLKEGDFAVFHDFSIKPESTENLSKEKFLKNITHHELAQLKFKDPELEIPLLSKVFQELGSSALRKDFWLDLEIKKEKSQNSSKDNSQLVWELLSLISKQWSLEKTAFRSFDWAILEELRKQSADARIIPLFDKNQTQFEAALYLKPQWIAPFWESVDTKNILSIKKQGIRVMPYTVNGVETWKKMIELSVDGITTDDPRGLLEYLSQKR